MIYFVGRAPKSLESVTRDLAEGGAPCASSPWAGLPESDAHLCILVSPPENHAERSVLASLVRRRVPLFSATEHPVYALYGRHTVYRLPCELTAPALRRLLSWFVPRQPNGRDDPGELAERNRRMIHELRLASELQRSILPRSTPSGTPVNLARRYVPYQYIGGDFYDFIPLEEDRLGLVIADASGHGIAAAFMTAMFKSAFGLFAQEGDSPARTLARLNTELARVLMTDHFMSAFYLIVSTTTGEVSYCSAGHPPQFLFRASGETVELSSMGFLLGSVGAARYEDGTLVMQPGDRLLLYTDGLVEATDGGGAQFGRPRIVQIVRRCFESPIEDISNELLSEAVMFLDTPTFQDDVTLILAELAQEL